MFGKIIRPIIDTFVPEYLKFCLGGFFFRPPISHVQRLGPFVSHSLVDEGIGGGTVCLKRCWWLGMTERDENVSNWSGRLRIMKQCSSLSISRTRNDVSDRFALS